MGIADHKCHDGQKQIACVALRNKHDRVIVQEKLDGSTVGVILLNSEVVAITRAGYRATSPYAMHHSFNAWVSFSLLSKSCISLQLLILYSSGNDVSSFFATSIDFFALSCNL